jgi:TRAP-type C4-dicarboxylate transport system permease small subunit
LNKLQDLSLKLILKARGELMILIRKLSDGLNDLVERLAVMLLIVMSLLTFGGVIARYIFNSPIVWLYETTLVIFSWLIFLGVSIAFKREEQITLNLIDKYLSSKGAVILRMITQVLIAVFLLIIVKDGADVVRDTMTQKYITINLSTGWFTAAFPVCAVVSLIHLLAINLKKC